MGSVRRLFINKNWEVPVGFIIIIQNQSPIITIIIIIGIFKECSRLKPIFNPTQTTCLFKVAKNCNKVSLLGRLVRVVRIILAITLTDHLAADWMPPIVDPLELTQFVRFMFLLSEFLH